jgi:hypothetical protein
LFDPIHWTAGPETPDELWLLAQVAPQELGVAWIVKFAPGVDTLTFPKPPSEIWNALDWKDDANFGVDISYCEPLEPICQDDVCMYRTFKKCARSAGDAVFFQL